MLDSEEDELDSADVDGVSVSVLFVVSTRGVLAGVAASAVFVASVGVVCAVVVVCVGSVSVV